MNNFNYTFMRNLVYTYLNFQILWTERFMTNLRKRFNGNILKYKHVQQIISVGDGPVKVYTMTLPLKTFQHVCKCVTLHTSDICC